MLRFLFPAGLFLSATLLFVIQPMVAKALLPVYGGTPAVWTVCMLFFQLVLLVSYAYVWLLSQCNKTTVWRGIHSVLALLSLLAVPLLFRPFVMDGQPEWSILKTLLIQLGFPIFIVAASAPLLQYAYSQTQEKRASDPYFLYAASNLGSLLALLLYPWIFEHFLGLAYQFHLWNIGYGLYLVLLFVILFGTSYQPLSYQRKDAGQVSWQEMIYWIFLSFIPCSMMLGVTLYITTDVAATPLFWVLPLALYLFTFVLTFQTKPLITHRWVARNALFFLSFTLVGFVLGVHQVKAWQIVVFNLLSFFILAILCHGELFQKRPKPQWLPLFYFCLALGGVLAGVFNGLLAPHWFNNVYEYPVAIVLSLFALPKARLTKGWWIPPIIMGLMIVQYAFPDYFWGHTYSFQIIAIIIIVFVVTWTQSNFSRCLSMVLFFIFVFSPVFKNNSILLQERNFYGVKQVEDRHGVHALISHSTVHGLEFFDAKKLPNGFTSYYGAIEQVIALMQQELHSMTVTIIGLGAGTMVCQYRASDQVQVIEIDEQMIDLARNSDLFTYLQACPAKAKLIKNDGRLAVAKVPDHSQNLLILDAFNSDAIPVHLMTREAFTLYQKKIKKDGVILVNLSNRHIQLLPVVNAMGRSLELMVFYLAHKGDPKLGQFNSEWALLSANQEFAFKLMSQSGWRFVADDQQFLWTDDYSNIIPLMKW